MQSVTITTKVVSSNPVDGEMFSMQHYVIKFVGDLRQFDGFLRVHLYLFCFYYLLMCQTSFKGFSIVKIENYPLSLIPASVIYRSCSVTVIFSAHDNAMLLALTFVTSSDPFFILQDKYIPSIVTGKSLESVTTYTGLEIKKLLALFIQIF